MRHTLEYVPGEKSVTRLPLQTAAASAALTAATPFIAAAIRRPLRTKAKATACLPCRRPWRCVIRRRGVRSVETKGARAYAPSRAPRLGTYYDAESDSVWKAGNFAPLSQLTWQKNGVREVGGGGGGGGGTRLRNADALLPRLALLFGVLRRFRCGPASPVFFSSRPQRFVTWGSFASIGSALTD